MSIHVTHLKALSRLGVASVLGLASLSANSQTAVLEPICQLSIPSGFCKFPDLTTPTVVMPTPPQALLYTASDVATFNRPFGVNSLWNIRPREVVFGDATIPASTYYPMVGTGKYSTSAFEAKPTDASMVIYPPDGKTGVWDPDAEKNHSTITIPHWPADTVPASGSDGHADIIDTANGIVHSFWQLRNTDGRWTAMQYAWSRLDGRGWGDAAHYFQGARAAGVPSVAGLIRKQEINDGESQYYHALAMSLTHSGLSKYEQYSFPATSGDRTYYENTGRIPTGALMMLPPDYDDSKIANADLRKIVRTLKTYGAYVVDRNFGTPFYIYVENGSGFNLHKGGWNSAVGNELQRVRAALRQVTYAKDWVNNQGETVQSLIPMNLVSMRGTWKPKVSGTPFPVYDTMSQSAVFGPTDKAYISESGSDRPISRVKWAKPVKGRLYEFRVEATNGGKAYLRFWGAGAEQFNTRALADGQTFRFYWPMVDGVTIMGAVSGIGEKTVVRGVLTEIKE